MLHRVSFITIVSFCILSCAGTDKNELPETIAEKANVETSLEGESQIQLSIEEANRLSRLPLKCITTNLPYKPGLTVTSSEDLVLPQVEHPAFYGCFDWHSAVHGHWSLIYLMKSFPNLAQQQEARQKLNQHLTSQNIQTELAYFKKNKYTKSFERTYGWAWILKLQEELYTWDDEDAKRWFNNLKPLAEYLSASYQSYLPKLVYPIRVGEHSNTAFGLSFAYDYAKAVDDKALIKIIEDSAMRFYIDDAACPISWEPSGYDFLSPCLQEVDIMRKVLSEDKFAIWLDSFLPTLNVGNLDLLPGKVLDRSDGKLVHLDGVNFSRAWCLYPLKKYTQAQNLAREHMNYSLKNITDGDYAGEHWLASFALYAYSSIDQGQ